MKNRIKTVMVRDRVMLLCLVSLFLVLVFIRGAKHRFEMTARQVMFPTDLLAEERNDTALFAKGTRDEVIDDVVRRDFPHILEETKAYWVDNRGLARYPKGKEGTAALPGDLAYYDSKGNRLFHGVLYEYALSNVVLLAVLWAYPLYLLMRLAVGAAKTLRKTGGTDGNPWP